MQGRTLDSRPVDGSAGEVSSQKSIRRNSSVLLTKLFYSLALVVIAVVSVANYILLEKQTRLSETSVEIVNLSGRQMMMAQRIAYLSRQLVLSLNPGERVDVRRRLSSAAERLETDHRLLLEGDSSMRLAPPRSVELQTIYFGPPFFLDSAVTQYVKEARALAVVPDSRLSADDPHFRYLRNVANSDALLVALDQVSERFRKERDSAVVINKRVGRGQLLTTLLILLFMAFFVFRPLTRRVELEMDKLHRSNVALDRSSRELNRSYQELKSKENALLGIMGDLEVERRRLKLEIAQRQRVEDALALQAKELARSNADLEQFAYAASHDLQEPLQKIVVFGDLLTGYAASSLDEKGAGYVKRMQSAAARMSRLIEDLLRFARVSASSRPFEPVRLNSVLEEVVADLELQIEDSGAALDIAPLPEVVADRSQMYQLFKNLISNALKYRKPDVPPAIRVFGRALPNGGYEMSVQDNGIGFDEKYLNRIFKPFERLHGASKYEGSGIGLAVCEKIANRHDWLITARSKPGEGATFVLRLPPVKAGQPPYQTAPRPERGTLEVIKPSANPRSEMSAG